MPDIKASDLSAAFGGSPLPVIVSTTGYQLKKNKIYWVDATSVTITLLPPVTGTFLAGDFFQVRNYKGDSSVRNITIDFATAGQSLDGSTGTNFVLNYPLADFSFKYDGTSWQTVPEQIPALIPTKDYIQVYKTSDQASPTVGTDITWSAAIGNMAWSTNGQVTLKAGKTYKITANATVNSTGAYMGYRIYQGASPTIVPGSSMGFAVEVTTAAFGLSPGPAWAVLTPLVDTVVRVTAAGWLASVTSIRQEGTTMIVEQIS